MPTYADFVLSGDDLTAIAAATNGDQKIDWKSVELADIKSRIKNLHLELQGEKCCYCRKSFAGEFAMVIDIEHVLPKSRFSGLTFSSVNLSVSCKRCNMNVKREKWAFVNGASRESVLENLENSATYQLIHPNLDVYAENLPYLFVQVELGSFRKFLLGGASQKGRFTYDFMKLKDVEVEDLDRLQGLRISSDQSVSGRVHALVALLDLDSEI